MLQTISRIFTLACAVVLTCAATSQAALPTGGFVAHLNQQNVTGFSDSRRSVTFYDTDDIAAGPLFSVFVPLDLFQLEPSPSSNGEEVDAIATNPTNGDTYVIGFDSGTVGTIAHPGTVSEEADGDLDLYRIDFQAAYDHWSTNFEGNVAAGMPGVNGPAPTVPAGCGVGCTFDDYVTYGIGPVDGSGNFDPNPLNQPTHSNTFVLPGVIEKVGEVKRNNGGNFFDFSLEFIDDDTLVMIDDSSEPAGNDNAAFDHEYRLLTRVSTDPGQVSAGDSMADHLDGGFNSLNNTESWISTRIGLVNQDFAEGSPSGHSEIESMAFHHDTASGVRGFWITESDSDATMRGDDVAFFEIDGNGNGVGYREHAVGPGPNFPTSFALDDDPATDSTLNDGQADHIFVDADTGDLIIVEAGNGDSAIASIGADHEPSVIRREVLSYDDGNGRIQFGAWGAKQILNPTKDPGDTFLERGHWAAYNSESDEVYFFNPGGGGETPAFQNEIFVLDVNTGVTTSINNIDESVALFFSDNFGDIADTFFIAAAGLPGDFNDDGVVNAADYTLWRDNQGDADESALNGNGDGINGIDINDYNLWVQNFGNTSGSGAGNTGVPEPACLWLLAWGGLLGLAVRRKAAGQ